MLLYYLKPAYYGTLVPAAARQWELVGRSQVEGNDNANIYWCPHFGKCSDERYTSLSLDSPSDPLSWAFVTGGALLSSIEKEAWGLGLGH